MLAGTNRGSAATDPRTLDSNEDRRRGLRIRQNRPIKVYVRSLGRYYGGQTHDVSGTGLRIELPVSAPIQPGKLLEVHVGQNEPGEALARQHQMLPARVVWMNRDAATAAGRLIAGIELIANAAVQVDAA